MKSVRDTYDSSFGAPGSSGGNDGTVASPVNAEMELDEMEKVHRPDHGTFFFGSRSDEIGIPEEFVFEPGDDWSVVVSLLFIVCAIAFLNGPVRDTHCYLPKYNVSLRQGTNTNES